MHVKCEKKNVEKQRKCGMWESSFTSNFTSIIIILLLLLPLNENVVCHRRSCYKPTLT